MRRSLHQQRGAALIIWATVLILGIAWFAVGALGKAARTTADKERQTGLALQAAKQALLWHVAQYAARKTTNEPGQLPCPESLNWYLAGTEGQASTSCSNATETVGRLPWRTLGIDQLRDADGEPLWYVLSRGFRNPPINFASAGQVNYNGVANSAVALIIAPGAPVNTSADPATPPAGCAKVNQQSGNRNSTANPLDPTQFFECGNATGTYANPGNATTNWTPWSNDRVLAITQAEWADAIAGPVADRFQRQVAPAMTDWRTTESVNNWGTAFLPYASTFSDPATNDLCGNAAIREGLPPVAKSASSTCTSWTAGTVTQVLGLLGGASCNQVAGNAYQCTFVNLSLFVPLTARISATAPNVAGSFRGRIVGAAPDIQNNRGGAISNFSLSFSSATGNATLQFDLAFPLLAILTPVTVTIANLPDAVVLSDSRMTWYLDNKWAQYTYYAAAPSATVNPVACAAPGAAGCIEVRGLPSSTEPAGGPYWNKRLVLVLSGLPLTGQSRSCATDINGNTIADCNEVSQYLEEQNATTGDRIYRADLRIANPSAPTPPYPPFNDRVATCPFQYTPASGPAMVICN